MNAHTFIAAQRQNGNVINMRNHEKKMMSPLQHAAHPPSSSWFLVSILYEVEAVEEIDHVLDSVNG